MTGGDSVGDPLGALGEPGKIRVVEGVAWLRLDDPAGQVNTLSSRFLDWFGHQLARLASEPLDGLVVVSGKPDVFVAGADLAELAALAARPADVLAVLER